MRGVFSFVNEVASNLHLNSHMLDLGAKEVLSMSMESSGGPKIR